MTLRIVRLHKFTLVFLTKSESLDQQIERHQSLWKPKWHKALTASFMRLAFWDEGKR
jgi:hypothetical protein